MQGISKEIALKVQYDPLKPLRGEMEAPLLLYLSIQHTLSMYTGYYTWMGAHKWYCFEENDIRVNI